VKSESECGKTSYGAVRENLVGFYLLLAGNDTVPVSLWRGGGMCCTEYRLDVL